MTDQPIDSLLHIADLHFWKITWNPLRQLNKRVLGNLNLILKRSKQFDLALAPSSAEYAASTGLPTALFTGDFSTTSLEEEFEMALGFVRQIQKGGFKVHLLPGNHDVYTFWASANRLRRIFAEYLPSGDYPLRQTLPGGTPLIVVPTVCPNFILSCGRITTQEIERTKALLAECESPVIVAGHYPFLQKTSAYRMTYSRELRGADALREALGESGKRILYIAGHVHRFSYTQDSRYENLQQLTTDGPFHHSRKQGTSGEFSEVHVYRDRFEVVRHMRRADWTKIAVEVTRE